MRSSRVYCNGFPGAKGASGLPQRLETQPRRFSGCPTKGGAWDEFRLASLGGTAEAAVSTRVEALPASVVLQNVGDQGAGEILREAAESGRVLFEEAGQILRDFVLLAKHVRRIHVKHLALAIVSQRGSHAHHDQDARRLSRGRVVGERRGRSGEHGTAQSGLRGLGRITIENVVVRPRGELAHDGRGQHLIDAISVGLVPEGRNGDGLDVSGKFYRVSSRLIIASPDQNRNERQSDHYERQHGAKLRPGKLLRVQA